MLAYQVDPPASHERSAADRKAAVPLVTGDPPSLFHFSTIFIQNIIDRLQYSPLPCIAIREPVVSVDLILVTLNKMKN